MQTSATNIQDEITSAISSLSSRGLKHSAAYLSDISSAFDPSSNIPNSVNLNGLLNDFLKSPKQINLQKKEKEEIVFQFNLTKDMLKWSCIEQDFSRKFTMKYLIAKSYFDQGDFRRAAFTLSQSNQSPNSGASEEIFLWAYSLYLHGEKNVREPMTSENPNPENENENVDFLCKELFILSDDQSKGSSTRKDSLEGSKHSAGNSLSTINSAFINYLLGVLLKKRNRLSKAREALLRAIDIFPLLWPAYEELIDILLKQSQAKQESNCFDRLDEFLPNHWMVGFFKLELVRKLQKFENMISIISQLTKLIPSENSNYLKSQAAVSFYFLRRIRDSHILFEDILIRDPYRLQDQHIHSHILFVKEQKSELGHLAHQAIQLNKFHPETCCIVGNYYSLNKRREEAIKYFRRALRLDSNFYSAWILMAHEYMELRNNSAAIACFKNAIKGNGKDYRPWYGLGQCYELLQMYTYAIRYYRQSVELQPYDWRTHFALAMCYERNEEIVTALELFKTSEHIASSEGGEVTPTKKLAKLLASIASLSVGSASNLHLQKSVLAVMTSNSLLVDSAKTAADRGESVSKLLKNWAAVYYLSLLERSSNCTGLAELSQQDIAEASWFLARYCTEQRQFEEAEKHCEALISLNTLEKRDAQTLLSNIQLLKAHN